MSIPRPGLSGIGSIPSASRRQPPAAISSINGEPVRYSTRSVSGNAEAICRTEARPTAVLAGHPRDAALLAQSAALGRIRLHDVERARLEPGLKTLTPRQNFAAGD